jgi:hypothetical protein
MADPGAPDAGVAPAPPLTPGTHAEARSGLDGSWQAGFVVEAATDTGYVLRREMDDAVLPQVAHDRVRRRRRRSTWWV